MAQLYGTTLWHRPSKTLFRCSQKKETKRARSSVLVQERVKLNLIGEVLIMQPILRKWPATLHSETEPVPDIAKRGKNRSRWTTREIRVGGNMDVHPPLDHFSIPTWEQDKRQGRHAHDGLVESRRVQFDVRLTRSPTASYPHRAIRNNTSSMPGQLQERLPIDFRCSTF